MFYCTIKVLGCDGPIARLIVNILSLRYSRCLIVDNVV